MMFSAFFYGSNKAVRVGGGAIDVPSADRAKIVDPGDDGHAASIGLVDGLPDHLIRIAWVYDDKTVGLPGRIDVAADDLVAVVRPRRLGIGGTGVGERGEDTAFIDPACRAAV